MHSSKRYIVFFLLAFAAVPAFAGNADLVHVSSRVSSPTANPGGANQGEVLITNNTAGEVRTRLDVKIAYSNGTVQRLTGIPDPGTLGPGEGFILSVYFIIPSDAPLGPANFVATVSAAAGGGLSEQETSSAPFDVVP